MDVLLLLMGLCLSVHFSSAESGCEKWNKVGSNVCCERCHPGNHLVQKCGLDPKELCKPCKPGTYTNNHLAGRCERCEQCIDPQMLKEACIATRNTVCTCKKGLLCGDSDCNFCIEECGKGQEPVAEERSCRPCPDGSYNDQIHQKCKPWSTRCPNTNQVIVSKGDALNDIKCENISVRPMVNPESKDLSPDEWTETSTLIIVFATVFTFVVIVIILVGLMHVKQKKPEKKQAPMKKTTIISNPTDEPRTLIAIECSFHEAEQEQGNSSESLLP